MNYSDHSKTIVTIQSDLKNFCKLEEKFFVCIHADKSIEHKRKKQERTYCELDK